MILQAILFLVAVLAGGTASVVGFGIGSLLTPLVALRYGMETAIAVVALPHFVATLFRALRLRQAIDWTVLARFGLLSAAGGLGGALLYAQLGNRPLTIALAILLLLTSVAGLSGWTSRWHPQGWKVWGLGLASGFFGGIAGNQGGLRAAVLGNFGLSPVAFVATGTAIGVMVDLARTPVYLLRAGGQLLDLAGTVGVLTAGVVVGTMLGERILVGLSPARFRTILATAIGLLGIWLLISLR